MSKRISNKKVKQMLCGIARAKYGTCAKTTRFKFEYKNVWVTRFAGGLGWLSRVALSSKSAIIYGRIKDYE